MTFEQYVLEERAEAAEEAEARGEAKGLTKGRAEGRAEGLAEGRAEGLAEGEAIARARIDGENAALHAALVAAGREGEFVAAVLDRGTRDALLSEFGIIAETSLSN